MKDMYINYILHICVYIYICMISIYRPPHQKVGFGGEGGVPYIYIYRYKCR